MCTSSVYVGIELCSDTFNIELVATAAVVRFVMLGRSGHIVLFHMSDNAKETYIEQHTVRIKKYLSEV